MTATVKHGQGVTRFFFSHGASVLILAPSLAAGICLLEDTLPLLQEALRISYLILFLASINFATAIMIEPYRSSLSRLSLPTLMSMVAVVFLFIVAGALKLQFFQHLDYIFLTPFVAACEILIYATIFFEKNIPLKCLLSLDSIALMFLCALSVTDKFTTPF